MIFKFMRVIKIPSSESDEASILEDSGEVCWDGECCLVDVCFGIAPPPPPPPVFLVSFSARAFATAHQLVFSFVKAQQFANPLHWLAEILLAQFSSSLFVL